VLTITAHTWLSIPTFDLELKIANSEDFSFVKVDAGPFGGATTSQPPDDKSQGRVKFGPIKNGPGIDAGKTVTVGITIASNQNDFEIAGGTWSSESGGTVPLCSDGGSACPDFLRLSATPVKDPSTDFTLSNNSDQFVTFTDLRFLNNSLELPAGAPVGSIPGFTPFASSVIVPPHSLSEDFIFGNLDPEKFLYVEANAFVSNSSGDPLFSDPSDELSYRFGHQAPVPEPSTDMLFATSIITLIGYWWRKRHRSTL
jgi:hypothetical protein